MRSALAEIVTGPPLLSKVQDPCDSLATVFVVCRRSRSKVDEPGRDLLEPGPPERGDERLVQRVAEGLLAELAELLDRIVWQVIRDTL